MIPSYRIDHLRKILGHLYDFEAFLGRGAFANVLRVRHLRLGRREALKVLLEAHDGSSDFAVRFVKEAKLVASLDHPNIVKVYDYGEIDGVLWYSMQYVEGVTLRAEIDHRALFSEQEVISVAVPLLDALENSHRAGIVHRDVKPGNIMISGRGRPYLMDFGIAKVQDSGLRTQTGSVLGTPAYISPEQASGEPVDGRSDVYSLAICLYQLLTGHLPFPGDDPIQMLLRRLKGDPLPPSKHRPEVDPALESIVLRALQKKPEDRFQSAAEMRRELSERFRPKVETQAIHLTVDMEPPQILPPNDPTIDTDTWPAGTDLEAVIAASEPTEAPTLITETPSPRPWDETSAAEAASAPRSSGIIGLLAGIIFLLIGMLAWQAVRDHSAAPTDASVQGEAASKSAQTEPEADLPVTTDSPATDQSIDEPNPGTKATTDPTETATESTDPPPETQTPAAIPSTRSPEPTSVPMTVRPAVVPPKLLERSLLELDEATSQTCQGSDVVLTVQLDAQGQVTATRVLGSSVSLCSQAAQDLVKNYQFQAGRDFEGQPTASSMSLSVRFP